MSWTGEPTEEEEEPWYEPDEADAEPEYWGDEDGDDDPDREPEFQPENAEYRNVEEPDETLHADEVAREGQEHETDQ